MSRFAGSEQRLYLKVRANMVEGMIKVGPRELFYRDRAGRCKEIAPLCVLDFFVHEKLQRQGLGKSLFCKMLIAEKTYPNKLAFDKPSPKLLKFLHKHFELSSYIPQNNNFVVFDEFFSVVEPHAGVLWARPLPANSAYAARTPKTSQTLCTC